ncbi:MAG: AAA family ATPase [Oscillospiraceae bacterium]|nr:AAA family ATPase [Oscillospiraceae bacterium]
MGSDPVFEEERAQLALTQRCYGQIADEHQEYFRVLPSLYPNESEIVMLNELLTAAYNRIVRLRQGVERPYFARIDFRENGAGSGEKYYLGKIDAVDAQDKQVTLDWRAPIATLYYDSNVGDVSYAAPGGKVEGALTLKRQFEIEKGELVSWGDVDTVSNDDLLRPYLGVNADSRLKNIIATIQTEQNRIIRERMDINLIVQGVAGSGKTTVALHRVAYLVYNYRSTVKPGQFMVIGPNRFFISYISSILPDLDVDSVPQYTYAELAREVIGEDFEVRDSIEAFTEAVGGGHIGAVEGYKASMAYKEAIDRFLPWYEQSLKPEGGFDLRGFPVLTADEVSECWDSAMEGPGSTVKARTEQCVIFLQTRLQNRKIEFDIKLSQHFGELYREPGADLDALHRRREYIRRELDRGCAKSLRSFFHKLDAKLLSVYRIFLQNCEMFLDENFSEAVALKKTSLAALRSRKLDRGDLPALLYLKERVMGHGRFGEFRHAVIDEAQDFGGFDFFALGRIMPSCTFTAVGDLTQAIYSYRGVSDWDSVARHCFDKPAEVRYMRKSYRTTVEIMEAANLVSGQLGYAPAEPVIRHGRKVEAYDASPGEMLEIIGGLIKLYLSEGFKSIAILAKTADTLRNITEKLQKQGINIDMIDSNDRIYEGGICAMPGYLSKGLEFDAVILCDAHDSTYRKSSRADMHLLYVEMTRALHRLDIFYDGWIAEPLMTMTQQGRGEE